MTAPNLRVVRDIPPAKVVSFPIVPPPPPMTVAERLSASVHEATARARYQECANLCGDAITALADAKSHLGTAVAQTERGRPQSRKQALADLERAAATIAAVIQEMRQ